MRKSYRVKKEADFQLVFDQHHSVANKMFIVYTMEREQPTHFRLESLFLRRLGCVVMSVYGLSVVFVKAFWNLSQTCAKMSIS